MLSAHKLVFDYSAQPLLNGISFELSAGQCLHVQGKNGVGKSTLLKLLVGLMQPHHGEVCWQGQSIVHQMPNYTSSLLYVGHQSGLSHALTVSENVVLDWRFQPKIGEPPPPILEALQLSTVIHHPVALLSEGQRRKAALLRLWMGRVALWVLDEPFVALDEVARSVLSSHLNQHLGTGGVAVITSHQPFELATPVSVLELI